VLEYYFYFLGLHPVAYITTVFVGAFNRNSILFLKFFITVSWSEFSATDPEARDRFPALPEKKSSGSGTGSTQPREYN
jgi:hypothetical protein